MATSLTILYSNAKRINIKVTPNTSILQILEEACKKQGLSHHDYDLVHQRKALDLSLSVRFANLSNNALLELRPSQGNRKESMVAVCVQTEDAGRLIHNFSPNVTLWDILNHWIQEKGQTLLQSNAGEDAEPVCLYMRKEVVGEKSLKETSLRSLGLTAGNAVIRLFYRVPETLRTQAHVESLQIRPKLEDIQIHDVITNSSPTQTEISENVDFKTVGEATSDHNRNSTCESSQDMDVEGVPEEVGDQLLKEATSAAVEIFTPESSGAAHLNHTGNNSNFLNDQIKKEEEEDPLEESDEIIYVGDNHAVLYSAKHIASLVTENLPDDFFELTVEDARYLYATLQQKRKDMENETLCTNSYKEGKKLERMLRFKNSILRLQFPNQLVLQAKFSPLDKISSVMEFIRQFLKDEKVDFYLFTTPPKMKLNPEQALFEVGLVPASLVYLGSRDSSGLTLKPEVQSKLSSHRAACEAASLIRKSSRANYITENAVPTQPPEMAPSSRKENQVVPVKQEERQENVVSSASTSTKVPKWFKGAK